MTEPAAGGPLAQLLVGRRGLAKTVHVWLPVAFFLSASAAPGGAATLAAVASVLVAATCFAQVSILVNDLFDRREDEEAGKPRWVRGLPRQGAVALLAFVAMLGGAALAFAGGSAPALAAYAGALALGIAYSVPPLRLKVRGLAGPAAYAAATAAAYALVPGLVLRGGPAALALLFAAVFLDKSAHLLHHQLADHDSDRRSGVRTFAVAAGPARARALLTWVSWAAVASFAAVTAALLRGGPWPAATALGSAAIGLAGAAAFPRGGQGTGAAFARELPPPYLGLGAATFRLLPALLLAGAALDRPLLWPVAVAAAATAAVELASYGTGTGRRRTGALTGDDALRLIAAAGLAVGIFVRVHMLADKPFWRDEAWVAALATGEIDEVLSTTRPSPVGFLLLVRLVGGIAGAVPGVPAEVSLRLVPLACGLAALVALPRLVRALGAPTAVPVTALLLAAGAPPLVNYARELKHYGVDLLFAVLVPLLVLGFFGQDAGASGGGRPGSRWRPLLAALATAPWVSFASAFPIAGTLAWGWLGPWRHSPLRLKRRWSALSIVYSLSLFLSYALVVRRQAGNELLVGYWARALAAGHGLPLPLDALRVLAECVTVPFAYLFPGLEPVAIALAALGLAGWPRPGGGVLRQLTLLTLLLTAAAVLTERYVAAHGRLLLFAAPLLLLSVAAGLGQLGRLLAPLLGRRGAAVPLAAGATALFIWSGTGVAHRLSPYRNDTARYFRYDVLHDVEPIIAAVAQAARPGEPVLVSPANAKAFRWYARGRLPGATTTAPPFRVAEARRILRSWPRKGRGWLILLDEERRFWSRALAGAGFAQSPVAVARGAQLWELRPYAGHPRAERRR